MGPARFTEVASAVGRPPVGACLGAVPILAAMSESSTPPPAAGAPAGGRATPRLVADGGPWVALCPAAADGPDGADGPSPRPPVEAPLEGVVVAVKDLVAVRGLPRGAGSRALSGGPPAAEDAPVVAAVRAAGGVVAGTVALHELAFGVTGINDEVGFPANPRDQARIPGGSSSGSAVAVADGSADLALGTDTGGSVRIPAALCGVVGFKPAYGALPPAGVLPLAPSLDHVGLLARSVAEVSRAYAALTGATHVSALTGTETGRNGGGDRLRLAVDQAALDAASPPVRAAIAAALDALGEPGPGREASGTALAARGGPGLSVEIVDLAAVAAEAVADGAPGTGRGDDGVGSGWPGADEVFDVSTTILFAEAARVHAALMASPAAARLGAPVAARLEAGAAITDADLAAARERAARISAGVRATLGRVDALLGPTVGITAPPIAGARTDPDLARVLVAGTRLGNITGLPALTIPVPTAGLPIGLQVMAADDAAALAVGAAVAERVGGGRRMNDA